MARAHTFPTVMGGLLALALTSAFWPSGAAAQEEACTDDGVLCVDRTIPIGTVSVSNDAEFFTVTYTIFEPWCINAAHLQIEDNLGDIPAAPSGTITPGRFDFKQRLVPCGGMLVFPEVPVGDERMAGDEVFVVAHATVTDEFGDRHGAWAGAQDFGVPGDATYFTYVVQEASCNQPGVEGASCTVFVTSQAYTGDLGGLAGARDKCREAADDAGLTGDYDAWLSTFGDDGSSPLKRFTKAEVPYELVVSSTFTGTSLVADDWADLVDPDPLVTPIHVTEVGVVLDSGAGFLDVWTATRTDGSAGSGLSALASDCSAWVGAGGTSQGFVGNLLASGPAWSDEQRSNAVGGRSCGTPARLYCFEQ